MNDENISRSQTHSPEIFTAKEAAEFLDLSVSTLNRMRMRRILRAQAEEEAWEKGKPLAPLVAHMLYSQRVGPKFKRFGLKVFYTRADLCEWIENPV